METAHGIDSTSAIANGAATHGHNTTARMFPYPEQHTTASRGHNTQVELNRYVGKAETTTRLQQQQRQSQRISSNTPSPSSRRSFGQERESHKISSRSLYPKSESYCTFIPTYAPPPTNNNRRVKSMFEVRRPSNVNQNRISGGYPVRERNGGSGYRFDSHLNRMTVGNSSVKTTTTTTTTTTQATICQCCYDETASDSLTCKNFAEPHSLCISCVTSYIREWLHGGNRNGVSRCDDGACQIPCFCSNEKGCSSYILLENWNIILTPAEIEQVNDRLSGRNIFRPRRASSSAIDEAAATLVSANSHGDSLARMCEQEQHKLEELKTQARLRSCPVCEKTFMKESGCNKMTCPNCLASMCYCCRKIVPSQGYDHFYVRSDDSKLNRCPLWTDDDIDERLEKDFIKNSIYQMAQEMRQYA